MSSLNESDTLLPPSKGMNPLARIENVGTNRLGQNDRSPPGFVPVWGAGNASLGRSA